MALEGSRVATNPSFQVLTQTMDVTDEEAVAKMLDQATSKLGRVDYAANCAGV